jgi:BolA family transcriptional regulator, general stress-responsive regulator
MFSLWGTRGKRQENVSLDSGFDVPSVKALMSNAIIAAAIRRKLEHAFAPLELVIDDESARHAGHSGARPEGETHFRVRIVSPVFAGLSRVERQRRVYQALKEELAGRVHALALTTLTPDEAA